MVARPYIVGELLSQAFKLVYPVTSLDSAPQKTVSINCHGTVASVELAKAYILSEVSSVPDH